MEVDFFKMPQSLSPAAQLAPLPSSVLLAGTLLKGFFPPQALS